MRRRPLVLPIFLLSALLLGSLYWGYQQYRNRQQLEVYVGNQYRQSFYSLVERVENVTLFVSKSIVTTGQTELVTVLNALSREAFAAQADLNQLPISNTTLNKTSKFLTQMGDYANALARQNVRRETMSSADQKKLMSLREQAANLSQGLHDLEAGVSEGKIKLGELVRGARRTIASENKDLLSNNFETMVQKNGGFPTLVYDGPFSDRIETVKPKGVTGPYITKEQAKKIATSFVDYNGNPKMVVEDIGQAKGKIPAWQFSVQPNDNEKNHTAIDITQKGGHAVFYLNPREIGKATITATQALAKGSQFLVERKFTNMVPAYSWVEDGVMTANYVLKQGNVIIYPDQIKLKVALDTGEVIGFEGLSFLMSHYTRKLAKAKVTEEQIYRKLTDRFDVESVRQAVIPLPSGKDLLTWEARVTFNNERYLLYYDAVTGEQVNTMRVIDTPNGKFAT